MKSTSYVREVSNLRGFDAQRRKKSVRMCGFARAVGTGKDDNAGGKCLLA